MSPPPTFTDLFTAATGHEPFPWQEALYERFVSDRNDNIPSSCDIPTGLGKTSVVAVWLIALAQHPEKLPRRLVYVVNRRTVVDQTTTEVEKLRETLHSSGLDEPLRKLCGIPLRNDESPLAISTLRGQFADNQEWSADPSRPAVICGTVDMIGSRLLFEGYRIGFKSRPLHAGFLGQDALLVHDEAHLEPAFQRLIERIKQEQDVGERVDDLPWGKLRVMALSATNRSDGGERNGEDGPFGLTEEERQPPEVLPDPATKPVHHVWRRLKAKKSLQFRECQDERKHLASQIARLALEHGESDAAILIFVRRVDDVTAVVRELKDKKKGNVPEKQIETLTGTMRGLERDDLVRKPVFVRFLPESSRPDDVEPAKGTVYLVCTSAGEVGVNLSADHMVCDLSTLDSMAQRFGRVNRFGEPKGHEAKIDVVYPTKFDEKGTNAELEERRKKTLTLLKALDGDASPKALGELSQKKLPFNTTEAFSPEPTILPATDILFDAWAMTTIKGAMPGRPPVAPYLHGVAEWEPPRTSVAWRTEVEVIVKDDENSDRQRSLPERYPASELLEDYPLRPHELLSDRTDRVLSALQDLAARHATSPVWLIDAKGQVGVRMLGQLADPSATTAQQKGPLERAIADGVVLLPPNVGGLSPQGQLDGSSEFANDVADDWLDDQRQTRRRRIADDPAPVSGMTLIRTIDLNPLADEFEGTEESEQAGVPESGEAANSKPDRFWYWYARPRNAEDATRASVMPITWDHHTDDVVARAAEIVEALALPDDVKQAIVLAAQLHDFGKKRKIWQRAIGNPLPSIWYAKSGRPGTPFDGSKNGNRWRRGFRHSYRHEFGSLLDSLRPDCENAPTLSDLSPEMRDVVLHLVAAHHGFARPHFPTDAFDHERYSTEQNAVAAQEVMRRYAHLQRRYGRWGLAYLESLLRAADWAASANPSENGRAS